jgi:hypothetical protein
LRVPLVRAALARGKHIQELVPPEYRHAPPRFLPPQRTSLVWEALPFDVDAVRLHGRVFAWLEDVVTLKAA